MSYRYEAAPGYPAPRRTRPAPQDAHSTSSRYRPAHSAPGPSVASYMEDNTARSTRERWHAAQAPTINIPADTRSQGARFARSRENPSSAYLHPNGQSYVPTTPVSPTSAYTSSPRAPSLSHSTDGEHDDDLECPPTPEHAPASPPPVNANNKSKSKSRTSTPTAPEHQNSYDDIEKIIYEMSSLVLSFQCPTDLEFKPTPRDGSIPGLTFSSQNRPLHEQNQKLEKLQGRLDAVESHGDADVRKARKEAVEEVERALESVKWMQALAWKKHAYEQRKKLRA